MESIFRSRHHWDGARGNALPPRGGADWCVRGYCVRVLTDVVRPLGVFTVVVQLLKTAMIRIAPSAGMMSLRIGVMVFL
jgi:hypothetical protein